MREDHDFMTIFESEIQCIARLTSLAGDVETGGMLYGLWTHGRRPVIMAVTGPGPGAAQVTAHFQQDLSFARHVSGTMLSRYGLQWIGDWHFHPFGGAALSGGDLAQVRSVTTKNNLGRWVDMLTTPAAGSDRYAVYRSTGDRPRRAGANGTGVRVTGFIHHDPHDGGHVRAPMRVLPGVSPFRLALLAGGGTELLGVGGTDFAFALERIACDRMDPDQVESEPRQRLPKGLIRRLRELPGTIGNGQIEISLVEDVAIIALPLPKGRTARVACDLKRPHRPRAVHVVSDGSLGEPEDLTPELLGAEQDVGLGALYQRLTRPLAKMPEAGLSLGSRLAVGPPPGGKRRVRVRRPADRQGGDTDGQ